MRDENDLDNNRPWDNILYFMIVHNILGGNISQRYHFSAGGRSLLGDGRHHTTINSFGTGGTFGVQTTRSQSRYVLFLSKLMCSEMYDLG